jgi:hypothetical protein
LATRRPTGPMVPPAKSGFNLLPMSRESRLLQGQLPSATKVRNYHLMPLVLGTLCPGDRSPLISRLHIAHSFAIAVTAGDEQLASQDLPDDSSEHLPAEVSKAELEQRAAIKFSGATGAVVTSGPRCSDDIRPTPARSWWIDQWYSPAARGHHVVAHNLPCECLRPAFRHFGVAYMGPIPRQRFVPGRLQGLWWPQPWPAWNGRHLKPCPGSPVCSYGGCGCMGRYVPTCPFRVNPRTGKSQGDAVAEARRHKIRFDGDVIFGEHLPSPPDSPKSDVPVSVTCAVPVSLGLGSAKVTLIYRILHIGVEDWIPYTTLFFSRNVQHRFMSRRTYEKKRYALAPAPAQHCKKNPTRGISSRAHFRVRT